MWYWHLLAGLMFFLGTVFVVASSNLWRDAHRGNGIQLAGLILFLGAAIVYSLH